MRQEQRFLLAFMLMIGVLVGTNILFPPVPPEEVSGPEGVTPSGPLTSSGGRGGNRMFVPTRTPIISMNASRNRCSCRILPYVLT